MYYRIMGKMRTATEVQNTVTVCWLMNAVLLPEIFLCCESIALEAP